MSTYTRDAILNLATDSTKAKGALTAAVRSILEAGTDSQTLAPLTDAWAIANSDQQKVLRATISAVSLDMLGVRWGFKDGVLRPTESTGAGRPAATTQDKLRKFIKAEGWKATLDALYAIAQQDAEAARELLAVVEVLNPKA